MNPTLPIQQDVELTPYNTLALMARAEYFCRVTDAELLREALEWARHKQLPVTCLGGGSNIVLAGDLVGLVLLIDIGGMQVVEQNTDAVQVSIGAGMNWDQTVRDCLARGWYGLENLALIPGRVGAAPIQNIGAYGVELSEVLVALRAVHINTGEVVTLSNAACQFGYRDSIFKGALKNRMAITEVTLGLSKTPRLRLDYPALAREIGSVALPVTAQIVYDTVSAIRRRKLPDPVALPNVGSFFKNPLVSRQLAATLLVRHPQLVCFPQEDGRVKLAAGWLLERAGWKGRRIGGAGVHTDQALVLVNYGSSSAQQILSLAENIRADIHKRFGVILEIEPNILGLQCR